MSQRRGRVGRPGRSPVQYVPIIVNRSLVEKIYDSILASLETGVNLEDALETYLPLLLNELDKLLIMYPEVDELFVYSVKKLWVKWFQDIPMPSISAEDSAVAVRNKVHETLINHRDRFLEQSAYSSMSEEELIRRINYTTLMFMYSVCSFVFSLLGVVT